MSALSQLNLLMHSHSDYGRGPRTWKLVYCRLLDVTHHHPRQLRLTRITQCRGVFTRSFDAASVDLLTVRYPTGFMRNYISQPRCMLMLAVHVSPFSAYDRTVHCSKLEGHLKARHTDPSPPPSSTRLPLPENQR